MTSYDVRNDKLTTLSCKNPPYQILAQKKTLQKEVLWSFVGQLLVIQIFLKKCQRKTSRMTEYDVRNEKLTILT